MAPKLPPLPATRIVVVREREVSRGFLGVRRLDLALELDGERSEPFVYDVVERHALDAAVIAAHFMKGGRRHVVLRSSLRVPFVLHGETGVLWELPAGLIEPGEAPIEAAARELNEEVGTNVTKERVRELGPAVIPVPAMIAERQHLFHVEIDPSEIGDPAGDGSALERASRLACVPVDEVLDWARAGGLPDSKSELALRRLVEVLA